MNARLKQIDPTVLHRQADLYSNYLQLLLDTSSELTEFNLQFARTAIAIASEQSNGQPLNQAELEDKLKRLLDCVQQGNEVAISSQKAMWQWFMESWHEQKSLLSQSAAVASGAMSTLLNAQNGR